MYSWLLGWMNFWYLQVSINQKLILNDIYVSTEKCILVIIIGDCETSLLKIYELHFAFIDKFESEPNVNG